MHHQRFAFIAQRSLKPVRVTQIEGKIVLRRRVQHAGVYLVEAFRRLSVAIPCFRPQFAGPTAHRICLQQRISAGTIALPDFQLTFFLEDTNSIGSPTDMPFLCISATNFAGMGAVALFATSRTPETEPTQPVKSASVAKSLSVLDNP